MTSSHPMIGMITARNCPTCGHHEIGYVDVDNQFHPLKPGDMIQVLPHDMVQNLSPIDTNPPMELDPDKITGSGTILSNLVAWAPDPVKGSKALRLKYGVLVDREMVEAGLSAGLYEIAYRQKLHRLIMEEKYTPLPVVFARFFGVPHLATGSPLEMMESLLEELDEIRLPIAQVQNWLIHKDDASAKALVSTCDISETVGSEADDDQFKRELELLTIEEFFEFF